MKKHFVMAVVATFTLGGCAGISDMGNTSAQNPVSAVTNSQELVDAIRDALKLSAVRASDTLAQNGAYQDNPAYNIGLPDAVRDITATLQQFGLGGPLEQVETAMNRAAELAAGEAKSALLSSISKLQVKDAMGIVRGGDTAAADYFESSTRQELTGRYRTIVEEQLEKVSFYPTYRSLLGVYDRLPISDKPQLDLEGLTVQRGLDALYQQIAEEERKIRANPIEQGSLLISSVFGRIGKAAPATSE